MIGIDHGSILQDKTSDASTSPVNITHMLGTTHIGVTQPSLGDRSGSQFSTTHVSIHELNNIQT
ncbi:MAG: hypothetical protein ACYTXY_08585, partial [Nostoc sp.]